MTPYWVYTETPLVSGQVLCLLQTPVRMLKANVDPVFTDATMHKMLQLCTERGDLDEIPARND